MKDEKSYFLFAGDLAVNGSFKVDDLHDVEKLCVTAGVENINLGTCISVEYEEEQGECGYLIYADFGNEYGILGQCNNFLKYNQGSSTVRCKIED